MDRHYLALNIMQGHNSMNIQSVKFANIFKNEVARVAQRMLEGGEEFRELDKIKGIIISRSGSYNNNLLIVFSGKVLGFKNIERVFVFYK
jgi:hypothetical protein